MQTPFELELQRLINRHSRESASNTPDFILARYLLGCLETFEEAIQKREDWERPRETCGTDLTPGFTVTSELGSITLT